MRIKNRQDFVPAGFLMCSFTQEKKTNQSHKMLELFLWLQAKINRQPHECHHEKSGFQIVQIGTNGP